ncbi:hypothetical protein BJY52DRAFT_1091786, partial [Lactarius psammicola]
NLTKSQYLAASRVPLIQFPALRVPKHVELPPDIHPSTLEPHVLAVEFNLRMTLAVHAARRKAFLRAREDEKQRRKCQALRCIALGFEPCVAPLVPVKMGPALDQQRKEDGVGSVAAGNQGGHLRGVMDDLVDRLAALE